MTPPMPADRSTPTPRTTLPAAARPVTMLIVLLVALGASLVVAVTPAGAHATLVELSPSADTTLDAAPTEIRLTFSEPVTITPDAIRIFDPSASELGGLDVEVQGSAVVAALPELSPRGSYTVAWKVVSADGHPVRGAYLFHLGEPTLTEPVEAGVPDGSALADGFRAFGAVLALAGLVVCIVAAVAGPRSAGAARWWALRWVPVLSGTLLLLGGAVLAVGSSLSSSLDVVLANSSGRMGAVAVAVALVGFVASVRMVEARFELALAVVATAAIALQGHAVSLPPVALSAVATLVHVVAAVAWAAGLFWLEHRTRTVADAEVRADVRRLSPWGMGAVVALAVTGVVLVVDRVPFDELASSTYGRLGILKSVALVVAVLLAWRNRRSVDVHVSSESEAIVDGGHRATVVADRPAVAVGPVVRQGIRIEMVVLAIALVAGAVLAQVPPPGEAVGDAPDGGLFMERQPFGDGELELTIDPGARGVNEIHVIALGSDGRLMAEAADLVLAMELPAEDLGPIEPEMQPITGGHSSAYARIPLGGTWTMTVTSRVDQFTELSASFEVPIGD